MTPHGLIPRKPEGGPQCAGPQTPNLPCPQSSFAKGNDYFVPTIDWMSDHLVTGIRRYLPVSRTDGEGRPLVIRCFESLNENEAGTPSASTHVIRKRGKIKMTIRGSQPEFHYHASPRGMLQQVQLFLPCPALHRGGLPASLSASGVMGTPPGPPNAATTLNTSSGQSGTGRSSFSSAVIRGRKTSATSGGPSSSSRAETERRGSYVMYV